MLERLAGLLKGRSQLSAEERDDVFDYYRKTLLLTGLQEREADRYNSSVTVHLNSLDDPESVGVMLRASRRLALLGKELLRRHAVLAPVPQIATRDYAAWGLLFRAYATWAQAQYDVFTALSQGREPFWPRVLELKEAEDKQRKMAEREAAELLRAVRAKASDLQQLTAAAQEAELLADWEPEDGEDG